MVGTWVCQNWRLDIVCHVLVVSVDVLVNEGG